MNGKLWRTGVLLGGLSTLLLLPAGSGAWVGTGPCSRADNLVNPYSGEFGHSFGDNFNPPWSRNGEVDRDHSHWGPSYGYLSSATHPTCTLGGGDDGGPYPE